jgi:acyl-CoA reductase-like NAD-dependent aldehyde dehydrogenase
MGAHQNYIAGEWVDGLTITRDINPSDTNDLVGEYAQADAAQTNAAIEAAKRHGPGRSSTSSPARCYAFRERSSPVCGRTSTSR